MSLDSKEVLDLGQSQPPGVLLNEFDMSSLPGGVNVFVKCVSPLHFCLRASSSWSAGYYKQISKQPDAENGNEVRKLTQPSLVYSVKHV